MKLLNYSTTYFALILIFLLGIWALIFYVEILDEIYDSMDDGLDNQKMLIIRRARQDPELLSKRAFQDANYIITPTTEEFSQGFTDSFRDTLMFMENELEYEPVRLLESVFEQDGSYYKIKVVTSMVEEDDLKKELFFLLIWLYLGLILTIVVLNNFLQQKAWRPFYKLLQRLERFSIEKDREIKFEQTNIEEFQLLNAKIQALLEKSVQSYHDQKEFIENASHELQTPLAISINKLELMAENSELTQEQMVELETVLSSLERLTRLNKSLLLLTKIENHQFGGGEDLHWNELITKTIEEFEDLAAHKGIGISYSEDGAPQSTGNKDLARILISNLLKNAILHSPPGTTVEVKSGLKEIRFRNTGREPLDREKIFSRFKMTGTKHSTGLGLAISKAISNKLNLELSYNFSSENHIFVVRF